MVFGEPEGEKGYSGGQEQDWMGRLERDLSLFNLPTEEKQWTLAAKNLGKVVQTCRKKRLSSTCMKRWFVKEKETVARRRALEVQNAQQLKIPLGPRPGGRKRSRVEGGVATAAINRPGKKVKAPAGTRYWPSF